MRFKRLIIMMFCGLLLTTVTGCKNEKEDHSSTDTTSAPDTEIVTDVTTESTTVTNEITTELPTEKTIETTTAEQTDYVEMYCEILEGFRSVIMDGYNPDIEILGDPAILYEINGREAEIDLGYAIEDISGDSIPELIIALINETKNGKYYGEQVCAVYTCSDAKVALSFEGAYRSSYQYKGDGTFFYRGSGGAIYSIFGTLNLQPNGKDVKWNDYYFTYEKDETFTEIGFYHNTLGISDKEQSEELDLTEDSFWEICSSMEKDFVKIELTPFVESFEERESSQLYVQYGVDAPFNEDSCDFYSVDNSEDATRIVFSTDGMLQDFKLLSLSMTDVDEQGNPEYSIDDIYSYGLLEDFRPLIVELTFYGDMPNYGVSYVDETGVKRFFAISMSGFDGSLELLEFNQ